MSLAAELTCEASNYLAPFFRIIWHYWGADDEGLAGGVDDVRCDGVELGGMWPGSVGSNSLVMVPSTRSTLPLPRGFPGADWMSCTLRSAHTCANYPEKS